MKKLQQRTKKESRYKRLCSTPKTAAEEAKTKAKQRGPTQVLNIPCFVNASDTLFLADMKKLDKATYTQSGPWQAKLRQELEPDKAEQARTRLRFIQAHKVIFFFCWQWYPHGINPKGLVPWDAHTTRTRGSQEGQVWVGHIFCKTFKSCHLDQDQLSLYIEKNIFLSIPFD